MIQVTFCQGANPIGYLAAIPKIFKTGSRGFYGHGKIVDLKGKRYQVNVQLVEIGSKERPA